MSTHNLLRLFKDSKKSLFKEAYFVFEEIPKGHDAADKAAREAAKKAEAERKAAEVKDKRREGTEKEGDDKSKEETTKDPLDEALRKLDQAAFDKIVKERITPKPGEKVLTLEQVEKLIIFAKTNDPQKNLKNLFDEFKDKHITVDQLSVESIKAFLDYTKDKPGDLDILITKFAEPKILSKINDFIAAGKDYPDAIKNIYAKTKEISDFYKNLNAEALTVLADKLDNTNFKELLSKLDNSQKGGLLEAAINGSKKEPILDSLVNVKSRLSALDPAISEKIINYIVNSKPERIATTLHHELGENNKDSKEAAKKLTTKAAETLLVKLLPGFKARDQGSQDIFLNIVNNLSLGSKKELINKKELDIEIRRRLFESIPSKDTAGIARPVEGAGVETKKEEPKKDEVKKPKKEDKKKPDDKSAGDKGTDKKADKKSEPPPAAKEEEIFSKDMTFNDIIAKMGDELTFDGKSISWKFPLSVDGKAIINERSFRVSPRFLKEFNKTDHNTRDKVKLCAYRWLYEKIYKNGKITKAKGKVTSFTESQAFLKNEIAKLAKAVETPVTERPK
ncbi:hypothetical protein HZA40_00480, partial [Candidatus Peregrinibacteria bacterium]|nr:hypothetical protein [Candidatus Peregrinibacteria bacterium]